MHSIKNYSNYVYLYLADLIEQLGVGLEIEHRLRLDGIGC